MNFTELQQAADVAMNRTLTNVGFRRSSPGTWNRLKGLDLNVIQLQKQSSAETFCVNLGIHYSFLPRVGTKAQGKCDQIEPPDCEFKFRLTAETSDKDQWWPISAVYVDQVAALVQSRGLPIFDTYRVEGELSLMDGKSIKDGSAGILASITKVRACLLLAHFHEQLGNRDRCVEAATIGIELAGRAVGPKKALKEILKRCGNP